MLKIHIKALKETRVHQNRIFTDKISGGSQGDLVGSVNMVVTHQL